MLQRFFCGGENNFEQLYRVFGRRNGRRLGAHTGHGQHGALGGLHHRFVRGGNAHFKRLRNISRVGLFFAHERF
ncbi:hypothetical protein SDC9_131329 [bioreactor metagenome]|uniref:Uncharacterized protein n=1 Tax=bioreactor metagenome TaxID=1076179 RepID=A0A645D5A0_9ZZZZ